jgi:hypothetical protein
MVYTRSSTWPLYVSRMSDAYNVFRNASGQNWQQWCVTRHLDTSVMYWFLYIDEYVIDITKHFILPSLDQVSIQVSEIWSSDGCEDLDVGFLVLLCQMNVQVDNYVLESVLSPSSTKLPTSPRNTIYLHTGWLETSSPMPILRRPPNLCLVMRCRLALISIALHLKHR